jgi:hypothetical protein
MQVRIDHKVDVVGAEPEPGESGQHMLARLHDRGHKLGKSTPPALRILGHHGMATGIEQHIALAVPQQRARHRKLDGLAALRRGKENALAHAQPSAGQKMHLHRLCLNLRFSVPKQLAMRAAHTMQ